MFTNVLQPLCRSPHPPGLMQLPIHFIPFWLWALAEPHLHCNRHLDVLELFSGEGQLSSACAREGFSTQALDRENGPGEDLGNMTGLNFAIFNIMSLKAGALLWLGPPCKNWVFLSTPQHQWRQSNKYLGENPNNKTKEANSLVYLVAALIRLAVARGIYYVIEQPTDSRMLKTACTMKTLAMTQALTVVTYLSSFCTEFPCQKGLHLCGTANILRALRRNPPPSSRHSESVYIKNDFTGAVSGGPDLESTQHYPREFGEAVATSFFTQTQLWEN